MLCGPVWDRGVGHSLGLLDRVERAVEDVRRPNTLRPISASRKAAANDEGPSNDPEKNPSS